MINKIYKTLALLVFSMASKVESVCFPGLSTKPSHSFLRRIDPHTGFTNEEKLKEIFVLPNISQECKSFLEEFLENYKDLADNKLINLLRNEYVFKKKIASLEEDKEKLLRELEEVKWKKGDEDNSKRLCDLFDKMQDINSPENKENIWILEARVKKLEIQIHSLNQEIMQLQEKNNRLQQEDSINHQKELKEKNHDLESKIESLKKEIENLTKQISCKDKENNQFKNNIELCQRTIKDLENQINHLNDNISNLKKENSKVKQEYNKLQQNIQKIEQQKNDSNEEELKSTKKKNKATKNM